MSAGLTTITVRARVHTGVFRTIPVTVTETPAIIESIEVSPSTISLAVGAVQQVEATPVPMNVAPAEQPFLWESASTVVATVTDDGEVRAMSAGLTTITVRARVHTGVFSTIPVTVTEPYVNPYPCTTMNPAATAHQSLRLTTTTQQCTITSNGDYDIITYLGNGNDPYVSSTTLTPNISTGLAYIKFEYQSDRDVDECEIFVNYPGKIWSTGNFRYAETAAWTCMMIQLPAEVAQNLTAGSTLRFDLHPGITHTLRIKNLTVWYEPAAAPPPVNSPYPCTDMNSRATASAGLSLTASGQLGCTMSNAGDHYAITYLGGHGDPQVFSTALTKDINSYVAYIKFEYQSNRTVDGCEIHVFYEGGNWSTGYFKYAQTDAWTCMAIPIRADIAQMLVTGNQIRFDLNPSEAQVLRIRNLEIRYEPYTPPANPYLCANVSSQATAHQGLRLTTNSQQGCTMDNQGDHDAITYHGGHNDPYAFSNALPKNLYVKNTNLAYVRFEYRSNTEASGCQLYVFYPGGNWYANIHYARTNTWTCVSILLPANVAQNLMAGSTMLRFDLNPNITQVLRIRNLEIQYDPYVPPANPFLCANVDPAATAYENLRLTTSGQNGCRMDNQGDHDAITYDQGHSDDPYALSTPVTQNISTSRAYIQFEYKSNADVDDCEIFVFYGGNGSYWSMRQFGALHFARTDDWICVSILLPEVISQNLVAGSQLRFDLNPGKYQVLRIKNLAIRYVPTAVPQPGSSINMERAVEWFYERMARKNCYSMDARYEIGGYQDINGNGCVEGDCSSSVMYALRWAGVSDPGDIYTETEHAWLLANGFRLISEGRGKIFNAQRGDIFIWGQKGSSGGAGGHTGIFVNANDIIHMTYGCNGICVSNYNVTLNANGGSSIYEYLYRYP
jgi:hypothetical protein